MKNILTELFNGNLSPISVCGKGNPEIEHLVELIERNKDDLFGTLDNSQKEILYNYGLCLDEYEGLILEEAFAQGFVLACQLMAKAFTMPPAI